MGTVYTVYCDDCGYVQRYFGGAGMADYNEENENEEEKQEYRTRFFKKIIAGKYGKEFKSIFIQRPENGWEINEHLGNKSPYYCNECEKIRLRYDEYISGYDSKAHRTKTYPAPQLCSACRSEMLELDKLFGKPIKCPKCDSHNAGMDNFGCWD